MNRPLPQPISPVSALGPGGSPLDRVPAWVAAWSPAQRDLADALLDDLVALARASGALELRLARLLAWFKRQDLAPLGYSAYRTFCRERAGWGGTWVRQLVRLVDSDLELVKAAVCRGGLPLSVAVLAPGRVEVEEQEEWLLAALRGEVRPERGRAAPRRRAVVLEGRSAREVHRARDLARLVTGRALSDAAADDFVLWCWRERVSGEQLLAEAREAPPVPEHPPLPPWCGEPDPATRLVGPWREPGDLEDGLELLEEVVRARQGRVVRLGRGYARLAAERLHLALGFDTLAELARQALGLSLRTLERYRRVAEAPGVEVLGLARAELVAQVARPDTEEDWVRVAGRTTLLELRRAVDVAGRGLEAQVLAAYRQALDRATDAVALGSMAAPPPAPGVVAVHPDLPEAASWFLEHVRPEPQRGFGKVKERDRFVCQNPECGRRSLRSQAHHIRFRSDGGEDALDNGLTLCPPCHLRLVHTGRVAAERTGDGVVWRYPGGRSVTVFGVLRSQPADEVSG